MRIWKRNIEVCESEKIISGTEMEAYMDSDGCLVLYITPRDEIKKEVAVSFSKDETQEIYRLFDNLRQFNALPF